MSQTLDFKGPLIRSTLAGCAAVAMYLAYSMMNRESEVTGIQTKEETVNQVFLELKKELRSNFSFEMPKDNEDGLITREFFIKLHVLIYKYKKYG